MVNRDDRPLTEGFEGWPLEDDETLYECPYCCEWAATRETKFRVMPRMVFLRWYCDNCEAHDEWERVY